MDRRFQLNPVRTLLLSLALVPSLALAATLPAFNLAPAATTVSGISSGGYMAVQYAVANSANVAGVGVFAGGPYECARGIDTALGACMLGTPDVARSIQRTRDRAANGRIDPLSGLAKQAVWLLSGYNDGVVRQPVMDSLYDYYRAFLEPDRIYYQDVLNAGHAMITADFGQACALTEGPYLNDCDYDGAGILLQHLYGLLSPPAAAVDNHLLSFDQSEFTAGAPHRIGMAREAFVYVPASCQAGQICRVHVAFHGCRQFANTVEDAFYRHAGYNRWAEANRLIVLYPQTISSNAGPFNPKGCWDWWGYNGAAFATRDGAQIAAVRAMLSRLGGGRDTAPAEPPGPTAPELRLLDTADDMLALAWKPVPGAEAYGLQRADSAAGPFELIAELSPARFSYADSSLAPERQYHYRLSVRLAGGATEESDPVQGETRSPAPDCDPYFSDNVTHVARGRARAFFGLAFARGSWDYMGFWSLLSESALYREGDTYQVGVCP